MMLGKRSRPPVKRTTSMTEFILDFNDAEGFGYQPLDHHNPFNDGGGGGTDQLAPPSSAVPRRPNRRNSADFVETANFLKSCFLCQRRLIPGRDVYMYRGDSAFCSLECRHQQMTQDERKEKCSSTSKKESSATTTARDQVSAAV